MILVYNHTASPLTARGGLWKSIWLTWEGSKFLTFQVSRVVEVNIDSIISDVLRNSL